MKNKFLESAKDDGIELVLFASVFPFMLFILFFKYLIDAILIALGLLMKAMTFIFMRGSHE